MENKMNEMISNSYWPDYPYKRQKIEKSYPLDNNTLSIERIIKERLYSDKIVKIINKDELCSLQMASQKNSYYNEVHLLLGLSYLHGWECEKNKIKGFELIKLAADQDPNFRW